MIHASENGLNIIIHHEMQIKAKMMPLRMAKKTNDIKYKLVEAAKALIY